jgi:error-prone DNA polymerase
VSVSIPFAHLQVASSYSLQFGANHPEALVQRAAELGQQVMALTDRDGLYGAVQWALACQKAGIKPVLGVDIAVEPTIPVTSHAVGQARQTPARRTPARGGAWVDEGRPRVMLIASNARGWASLCRLVSIAHTGEHTERGKPWLPWEALAQNHEGVVALLGAQSELGRLMTADRSYRCDAVVRPWRAVFGRWLGIAITSHRQSRGHRHSTAVAARTLGWARSQQLPVVLTNAVRYLDPAGAHVAQVLDASRLLVPLRSKLVESDNGEGYVKSGAEMAQIAEEISRAAGERNPEKLLTDTMRVAQFCALDPVADLGIGQVFVPELDVLLGRPVSATQADHILMSRCRDALPVRYPRADDQRVAADRLDAEMATIQHLGFSGYFLTVAEVVEMIKAKGVRVAARGSGAGSLVTHLLGISGADPIRHGLLMERFLSPLRRALPDIDIDVESARRIEAYEWIFERFGAKRVACVSMMETYRVRHAVRDVGAAMGLPAADIDTFAKSFPHLRARHARSALADLPELRSSSFGKLAAAGKLDHFLDLVEALDGLPRHVAMHPCGVLLSDASLLDRTPVERSGAGFMMSHFDKHDVEHMGLLKLDVLGVRMQSAMAYALDEINRTTGEHVELDDSALADAATFELIRTTRTLGCFQIESPGQRELIGKFAPETFADLIIDISLFRPGPVKSDMITPFLRARQGWSEPVYLHPDLKPFLEETCGVVVFHEQVLQIISTMTGCSLAEADESRRSMGSPDGMDDVRAWFYPAALRRRYDLDTVEKVWEVLRAFASFGFCKAHAAAFALPTYQSAWLKTHHPAAFFAGVLTHDPGMYPKRLILDDARHFGIAVLGLDVNASRDTYRVEHVADRKWGIRVPFTEVSGVSSAEVERLMEAQPFADLSDTWNRAGLSRPVAESLVVAGAFDALHSLGQASAARSRRITRRDLLLQIADLDRYRRSSAGLPPAQLSLDLTDHVAANVPAGLPEMDPAERVRAEVQVTGLDISAHVIDFYADLLDVIGTTKATDLLNGRSRRQVFIGGVKVAVQTPPVRSGRRVIFLTLDDSTGPVDAAFFEDAQGPYAQTVFSSWLLLIRGELRRTGPRGVSVRATGCWELGVLRRLWREEGIGAVRALLAENPVDPTAPTSRPVLTHPSGFRQSPYADVAPAGAPAKLWHSSPGSSGW